MMRQVITTFLMLTIAGHGECDSAGLLYAGVCFKGKSDSPLFAHRNWNLPSGDLVSVRRTRYFLRDIMGRVDNQANASAFSRV